MHTLTLSLKYNRMSVKVTNKNKLFTLFPDLIWKGSKYHVSSVTPPRLRLASEERRKLATGHLSDVSPRVGILFDAMLLYGTI